MCSCAREWGHRYLAIICFPGVKHSTYEDELEELQGMNEDAMTGSDKSDHAAVIECAECTVATEPASPDLAAEDPEEGQDAEVVGDGSAEKGIWSQSTTEGQGGSADENDKSDPSNEHLQDEDRAESVPSPPKYEPECFIDDPPPEPCRHSANGASIINVDDSALTRDNVSRQREPAGIVQDLEETTHYNAPASVELQSKASGQNRKRKKVSTRRPCIITFDSLGHSRKPLTTVLQAYLVGAYRSIYADHSSEKEIEEGVADLRKIGKLTANAPTQVQ